LNRIGDNVHRQYETKLKTGIKVYAGIGWHFNKRLIDSVDFECLRAVPSRKPIYLLWFIPLANLTSTTAQSIAVAPIYGIMTALY